MFWRRLLKYAGPLRYRLHGKTSGGATRMRKWHSYFIYSGIFVFCLASAGCQTADTLASFALKTWLKPKPTVLNTSFRVSPDVNPDLYGNSRSINVTFYVLSSVDLFEDTAFFAMKDQDKELFAEELKFRKTFEFEPGQEQTVVIEVNPEDPPVKKLHAAVVGAYRDLENTHGLWRGSVEVPGGKETDLVVELKSLEVAISIEN